MWHGFLNRPDKAAAEDAFFIREASWMADFKSAEEKGIVLRCLQSCLGAPAGKDFLDAPSNRQSPN